MLFSMSLIVLTLVACGILAAWPLIVSRALRSGIQGVCGMLCLVAGAGGFFALTTGLAGSAFTAAALAQEADSGASSGTESASVTSTNSGATTDTQSTSLHSLPLTIADDVIIPPGRPAWVESKRVREGAVHTSAVKSEPFKKDSDARAALDEGLERETAAYIAETLGSQLAPQFIRYDAGSIRAELVRENVYHETIESPTVGAMEQYHALITFPQGFQDRIRDQWNEVKAKWRLAQLGLVAGGAIMLLGTVFGYFRVDNATRGYYTGRLQFLSAAAILAIVGAGVVLARWIHWL